MHSCRYPRLLNRQKIGKPTNVLVAKIDQEKFWEVDRLA